MEKLAAYIIRKKNVKLTPKEFVKQIEKLISDQILFSQAHKSVVSLPPKHPGHR